jgi:hypothetical protein
MTRRPRDLLFKKTDFARLVAAARSEGLPIARIDAMRDGLSLVVGEPTKNDTATDNPWDKVLTNAADQERPA